MKYAVLGWKGEAVSKINIVFAFPKAQLEAMKSGITIQKNVQAQGLRTPKERKDRDEVATDAELHKGDAKSVRLLMRSGHVLRGKQISVSPYTILLEISGESVLVYRHALMEHTIEGAAEPPSVSE